MHKSMYGFIWAYSKREQLIALTLTLVSFPFLYFSLDLPKTIINRAIKDPTEAGVDAASVPTEIVHIQIFGYDFTELIGIEVERLTYLLLLCGLFLALVCINGVFKMRINTFVGIMSERLLRRLRYILVERTLRFPLPQFQKTSSGEVVTMVTAEVEPLGGFFGDAIVLVAFQGGTFLTIIYFLFAQDPMMGLAATALVPVQGYIIPKLQRKVNLLGKERVRHVRGLSNRIGEVINGVTDVRAHANTGFILSDLSRQLGRIFWVRLEIYQRKFFMKFVNNFINQMTPFLFFAIGGYLVLYGELSIGALVAALAAYKDLAAPWKELLNWYQRLADSKIKYEQLIGQFQPPNMLPAELQENPPQEIPHLDGDIVANSLSWADEDGVRVLDSASFTLSKGQSVAVVAASGTAKDVFSRLLSRVLLPTGGSLSFAGKDADRLHESVIGARVGLVNGDATFFNGTILDNVLLGLSRLPPRDELDSEKADEERLSEIEEALASGNSPFSPSADWIDYRSAGFDSRDAVLDRITDLLDSVELREDFYALGLRLTVDPDRMEDLAAKIAMARPRINETLTARAMDDLVQTYDFDRFNTYASVGGNIIFGKATQPEWEYANWMTNPTMLAMMKKHELLKEFYDIGLRIAGLMVDLFKDVPPGHPFFDQYSFVNEELLPELKMIVRKADQENGAGDVTEEERRLITSLPFSLTVQRHRLGVIDETMQRRLVALRKDLRDCHPEVFEPGGGVESYDAARINQGLSILDNILFGRVVHGRADAWEKVGALVHEVVRDLDFEDDIIRTALNFQVGIGGGRLSTTQRQKLNLMRSLLKNPDVLILNDGLSGVDTAQRDRIMRRLRELLPQATTIWIGSSTPDGVAFDRYLELKNGRVFEASDAEQITEHTAAEKDADEREEGSADEALTAEARSLHELPLFSNLDANKLKFLAFTSERLTYNPGEVLMQQGDEGEAAYVILDGAAEVVIVSGGKEQVLFELGANKLVGELALLCDSERTATVRARKKTTALRLNREVFSEMARQDPHFAFEMTRDLGRRLILTTSELNRARNEIVSLSTSD
ncbi:cyclic nucleotide-binding domain-containing protein [Rhodospirillaceae bacterium KN72]|uniref:Cyclic nucleotide-binding domain-containing protein n=1 Tax=Pacificispira spongiicola TaxID=2729598 RepID=A0A7Y0E004_9PROT|nr:ABC transporter transmembrane domain-containing protein [Pacificispira spongiicola]NMM44730.1 cyclic nucleotide-binding domain-containing protein [Pacificispira spongiicola]